MTDAAFDALIDATFGKTQAEATKRIRESERRRRSQLHWPFADADTQAIIPDRHIHDCRTPIYFRSGHRRRKDAPSGRPAPAGGRGCGQAVLG
jgi:hypothetical protein